METIEYSSGMASESFWYAEMKTTAKLRIEGSTWEEIKNRVFKENIYQCPTPRRTTRLYGSIMRRLEALPQEAVALLAESTLSTGKQIILLSIMRTDRLFCEFIAEVFTPRLRRGDYTLSRRELNSFFSDKARQSDVVGNWSDATILRLKRAYIRTLIDTGLVMPAKEEWTLYMPILDPAIQQIFTTAGMKSYITLLLGDAA